MNTSNHSENQFYLLAESSPDAIFVGAQGRFTYANPAALKLFGAGSAHQLLDQPIIERIHPDDRAVVAERIRRLYEHGESAPLLEETYLRLDGTPVAVEVSAVPFRYDGEDGGLVFVRDITQRKRAENALRESEARFRQMFERNGAAMLLIEPESGAIKDANTAASRFYGYSVERLRSMQIDEINMLSPAEIAAERARAAREECNYFIFPHRLAGGEMRTVEVHLSPVDVGGRRLLLSIVRDVTERKRAEAERRLAASVFANSYQGIMITDADNLIVDVNPAFTRITGYAKEEIIGKNPKILASGRQERAFYAGLWKSLLENDFWCGEILNRRKNGEGYAEMLSISAVRDDTGWLQRYIGVFSDITQRKWVEDALRDNQQKLNLFIEGVPAGIAMFDRDMRYLAVSRRFLEDYGIADADVIGRSHYEIFPKIPEHWRDLHRRCLAGETLRCEEDPVQRANGSVDWVRWESRPWFAASGEVGGMILFSEDITSRKRAEEGLADAKAEAERANNAKSRFLAAASHDLRQPLSALSLYVGVLENKLAPADGQLSANMRNCVANLSEMLSDLLDLSKLEAGVVTPNVSDFALDAILTKLASSHAPEANVKGLAFRYAYFGLIGRTDPVLFQRIVGNLVANAIRYTEQGGVLVGCRRRQGKLWVEVWDTGIGIPADKTGEIFEEFKQLGNHERNRAKGSGLGLAIVAKTAALLGLQVRVRSRPGKGSVFAVELPLGEAVRPAVQCRYTHRPLRIALVEDNADVATALVYALTDIGHQVVSAASRLEFQQLLDSVPPDIVISDYRLAGEESGFDVIGSLRATFGDDLPAIIITGDTDPAVIRLMAEKRISVHHKPLDLEALRARIAALTA